MACNVASNRADDKSGGAARGEQFEKQVNQTIRIEFPNSSYAIRPMDRLGNGEECIDRIAEAMSMESISGAQPHRSRVIMGSTGCP